MSPVYTLEGGLFLGLPLGEAGSHREADGRLKRALKLWCKFDGRAKGVGKDTPCLPSVSLRAQVAGTGAFSLRG